MPAGRDPRFVERLLEPHAQPVLVAAGDQRGARRRTHGGIGIGLQKAHAGRSQVVDAGCGKIAPPVAGQIRESEIVRHEKDDVGRSQTVWPKTSLQTRRQGNRAERRATRSVRRVKSRAGGIGGLLDDQVVGH